MSKKSPSLNKTVLKRFRPEEYYFDERGSLVFTAVYHLKRGYCCKKMCKHCPYKAEIL